MSERIVFWQNEVEDALLVLDDGELVLEVYGDTGKMCSAWVESAPLTEADLDTLKDALNTLVAFRLSSSPKEKS